MSAIVDLGETIVALSTAAGRAALATVRVSGPGAIRAVGCRFRGGAALEDAPGHTLHVGKIVGEPGTVIDEVVVSIYRAPRSYTGEDLVEISCHGNALVIARVIEALEAEGVRLAEPGEFTRRAFLNGKIDLTQAEAVGALIQARTDAAARAALRQLEGQLSERVRRHRESIVSILAGLEVHIDFPDEDLSAFDAAGVADRIHSVAGAIVELHESARRARPLAHTTTVVLTGTPNVGKSSLFNALLGRERAIVHERPGTTRDVVDAELVIGRVAVRLVDTAGLGAAGDDVEAEGIRRSRVERDRSDRVVVVLDATRSVLLDEERAILRGSDRERMIVVINKCDLASERELLGEPGLSDWSKAHRVIAEREPIAVSARTGQGLGELRRGIEASILGGEDPGADPLVVSLRQERDLEAAANAARAAERTLVESRAALELVAEDLREAGNALGRITGERVDADLLDAIFSEFCIGK